MESSHSDSKPTEVYVFDWDGTCTKHAGETTNDALELLVPCQPKENDPTLVEYADGWVNRRAIAIIRDLPDRPSPDDVEKIGSTLVIPHGLTSRDDAMTLKKALTEGYNADLTYASARAWVQVQFGMMPKACAAFRTLINRKDAGENVEIMIVSKMSSKVITLLMALAGFTNEDMDKIAIRAGREYRNVSKGDIVLTELERIKSESPPIGIVHVLDDDKVQRELMVTAAQTFLSPAQVPYYGFVEGECPFEQLLEQHQYVAADAPAASVAGSASTMFGGAGGKAKPLSGNFAEGLKLILGEEGESWAFSAIPSASMPDGMVQLESRVGSANFVLFMEKHGFNNVGGTAEIAGTKALDEKGKQFDLVFSSQSSRVYLSTEVADKIREAYAYLKAKNQPS